MNNAQRRHLRWLLFGQQDGRCFYCHEPMVLSFSARDNIWGNTATLEHLKRKAEGGGDGLANFVAACKDCNGRRGKQGWTAYRLSRLDRRTI